MPKSMFFFVLGAALVTTGLYAVAVGDLISFKAGDSIKSADVNQNFSTLKSAVDALEAPIGADRLGDGSVTLPKISVRGTAADGKVLKLQGGLLTWADDLLGTGGGTAYSAGSGLGLSGTTFSIADGGVTALKLSATGGADGKVLKLSGGNLAWADDLVGGGGGTTYSADGASLQLSGTTFSVRDGGISGAKLATAAINTAKLADGAVTGPKLANRSVGANQLQSTLEVSGFNPVTVVNTTTNTTSVAIRGAIGSSPNSFISTQVGVEGIAPTGIGVYGHTTSGTGVTGNSETGRGVDGNSQTSIGVDGFSQSYIGTRGQAIGGANLIITSPVGLLGESTTGTGILGASLSGVGIRGQSSSNDAIVGISRSNTNAGIVGSNYSGGYAGYFEAGFNGPNGSLAVCTFKAGTTGWSCSSDKNLKDNFKPINPAEVLEAVAKLPVTTWNMKGSTIRQLGPTAQDFYAAFKLGNSDKTINNTDAQGVALAAIKGLYQKNQALEAQVKNLQAQVTSYKSLEQRLAKLESQLGKN